MRNDNRQYKKKRRLYDDLRFKAQKMHDTSGELTYEERESLERQINDLEYRIGLLKVISGRKGRRGE